MELNSDMIGIQGVLIKCSKTVNFLKINYRGGNEIIISKIIKEISKFLKEKKFIDNEQKVIKERQEDLNGLIFFLALNTEFKKLPTILQDYSHLVNLTPKLSMCLFTSICFDLDLIKSFGNAIEIMPLENTKEFLDKAINFLENSTLNNQIENTYIIIESLIKKLSAIDLKFKVDDLVEDITKGASIILQNLLCVTKNDLHNKKLEEIYQYIGLTLFYFMELLLYIDPEVEIIYKLLSCLIRTTCELAKCITINVFCSWVEIQHNGQPLQLAIAEKAHYVVKKYEYINCAKDLVGMLKSIAKKPPAPLNIYQKIQQADCETVIRMIEENDENQKLWYKALLKNLNNSSSPNFFPCLEKWWYLCDENDLNNLLNSNLSKELNYRKFILKCISNLPLDRICVVLSLHLSGQRYRWNEDITDELITGFNQNVNEKSLKDLLLFALRNTEQFFEHFYLNAFKCSTELAEVFVLLKNIAKCNENNGRLILLRFIHKNPAANENLNNYIQMFNTMLTTNYFSYEVLVAEVLFLLLNEYKENNQMQEFKCCLQILISLEAENVELATIIKIIEYLIDVALENRCKKFFEFDTIKMEITEYAVQYLYEKIATLKKITAKKAKFPNVGVNDSTDQFSSYYKELLWNNNNSNDIKLSNFLIDNIDLKNYKKCEMTKSTAKLFKILPRCVSTEWKILLGELSEKFSFEIINNVIADILVLICAFADNQLKNGTDNLNAIQHCLQNYGAFLISIPKTEQEHILAVNNLCSVLKKIPQPLKSTEGINLINSIPNTILNLLKNNIEFIENISQIQDPVLIEAFGHRLLSVS